MRVAHYDSGVTKSLSKSELVRGYITASQKKSLFGDILGKPVKIFVNDNFIAERTYDRGRIIVGRTVTKEIGNKTVNIKIEGSSAYINY